MPEYRYDQGDGKIHSRYSHLQRCTPGQVDRLVAQMHGEDEEFSSAHTIFGTQRHELWAEESLRTGTLPRCFDELPIAAGVRLDHIEQEFATELVRGVVVHSRPDAVSIDEQVIWDYKTTVEGLHGPEKTIRAYRSSKQALFYALQLQLHGIPITRAIYLCEIWDNDREHILGYRSIVQEITAEKIAEVKGWAIERIVTLKAALRQLEEAKASIAA